MTDTGQDAVVGRTARLATYWVPAASSSDSHGLHVGSPTGLAAGLSIRRDHGWWQAG